MCGFCGFINYKNKNYNSSTIKTMNNSIIHRGPSDQNIFLDESVALGHVRLSIIDPKLGKQPMQKTKGNTTYTIVYNGELYNSKKLKNDLTLKGYSFKTNCDTEVILTSYIEYGKYCLQKFNGIFSFAIYESKTHSIFLARDHLGIKPLFYSISDDNTFLFASEIKAILESKKIKPVLDKQGLLELLALGPAHTPGITYFKNIFEIKAGHFALIKNDVMKTEKYWDLETKDFTDTESEAILKIKELVSESLKGQLISDVGISSMLSGGIDSSILSKLASDNIKNLTTFSIDFKDNDKNFIPNDYQISKDSDYVKIMLDVIKTDHKQILIDNTYLFNLLKKACIARDMPGMADIDCSMYAFCEKISQYSFKVCISGECSDEIFGGYPWFYKSHLSDHFGFPWALSENLRANIVRKELLSPGEINDYIIFRKNETLKNVTHLDKNDTFENKFRNINYLTVKWFMNCLVERTDRMSMANSLEVRVPFADYRIFDYVYNIPAKMKLGLLNSDIPIEKYMLRKAFENDIPNEVLYRKKSPFPKTYDPKYLSLAECELSKIISNKNSKLNRIINTDFIKDLISTHGKNLKENWFGQLMTYPQTLAYLIQISFWLEYYKIEFDF